MGMFVHGDHDERSYYEQRGAMETLGIKSGDLVDHYTDIVAPPTHKDVLLERWAKDTEAMASRMIGYDDAESKFFTTNIDGEITNRYEHVRLALEAQIAYLNSAAEVRE